MEDEGGKREDVAWKRVEEEREPGSEGEGGGVEGGGEAHDLFMNSGSALDPHGLHIPLSRTRAVREGGWRMREESGRM